MKKVNRLDINNKPFECNYLKILILYGSSFLFYLFFLLFANVIHNTGSHINIKELSPWLQGYGLENDGIELYVMTLSMPIFLLIAYLISVNNRIDFFDFQNIWIKVLCILIPISAFGGYLLYSEPLCKMSFAYFIVAFALMFLAQFISFSTWNRYVINLSVFIIVVVFGIFVNDYPSIGDYDYFLGPANKLLQGEKLGSFFMQYDLLTTLVVTLMLKMKLMIHEIHFVMIMIFALWILMYKKLATNLFENKNIVIYFIVMLLIVRGVAIMSGPLVCPQVNPMRLDLWVPLFLLMLYYDLKSILVSVVFTIAYLLDDVFGFLYLALYLFSLLCIYIQSYIQTHKNPITVKSSFLFAIPFIGLVFHLIVFKTLASPAGKMYSEYHLGMSPISIYSSFWLLILILSICVYFLVRNRKNRGLLFFLFGIVCVQLSYFFGRSSDNNLRNISGIFIFILFLVIDRLYSNATNKKLANILLALLIAFVVLNYNKAFRDLRFKIAERIESKQILYRNNSIEKQIEADKTYLKRLKTKKIIILSDYDGYLNYRMGYQQIGYFSPFHTHMKSKETVEFIFSHLKNGYIFIVYPAFGSHNSFIAEFCIKPYNEELLKMTKTETLKIDTLHNYMMQLKLIKK